MHTKVDELIGEQNRLRSKTGMLGLFVRQDNTRHTVVSQVMSHGV
jgi:hypothetical protein